MTSFHQVKHPNTLFFASFAAHLLHCLYFWISIFTWPSFFLLRFNNHEVCFRKVNCQSIYITPYFHFLSSELTIAFTSSSSWLSWLLFCSVSTPRFPYINDYRAVTVFCRRFFASVDFFSVATDLTVSRLLIFYTC